MSLVWLSEFTLIFKNSNRVSDICWGICWITLFFLFAVPGGSSIKKKEKTVTSVSQSMHLIPQVFQKSVIIWMTTKVTILTKLRYLRKTSHPVKHHFEPPALLDHPTGLSAYIGLARRAKSITKQGELPKTSFTPQQCCTQCHVKAILTRFQKCHRHLHGQHANAAGPVAVMNMTMRRVKKTEAVKR